MPRIHHASTDSTYSPPSARVRLFVPDWDDRVDPGYDFQTDRPTLGRDPYQDDLYAHELVGPDLYDGVLVSRMALNQSGRKRSLVEKIGMRRYLRLPPHLALMGDCGAYSYIHEIHPPFDTDDVVAYYEELGFDYGVSVDHAIVPELREEWKKRYDLTLRNAERFLATTRHRGCSFKPIGAIQGWDPASYQGAARAVVSMGYKFVAVGGLARRNSNFVEAVMRRVREVIPLHVKIHVFGVGRLSLLPLFNELKVDSIDSATPIRQAWLSANDNYYTLKRTYAAIRIPMAAEERAKSGTLVSRSRRPLSRLIDAERRALDAIRAFEKRRLGLRGTLEAIIQYDILLAARLDGQSLARRTELYRETLSERPWAVCGCPICKEIGVEVIIFRGNNRNRRRGFHNLWVLTQRVKRLARRCRPERPTQRLKRGGRSR